MKRSRLWASLLGIVIVSASLLVVNLALGNTPVLGLDLRGGVSVILASTEGAGDEDLIVIRDLIRDELEQRGIAEPDVRVEGSNVIVDLPGRQGSTGRARRGRHRRHRRAAPGAPVRGHRRHVDHGRRDGGPAPSRQRPRRPATRPRRPSSLRPPTTVADAHRHRDRRDTVGVPPRGATDRCTDDHHGGANRDDRGPGLRRRPRPPPPATARRPPPRCRSRSERPGGAGQQEVLPVRGDTGEVCIVGPSGGTGEVFERGSAEPSLDQVGAWGVTVDLRSDGEAAWNLLASQCNQGDQLRARRASWRSCSTTSSSRRPSVNEPFFSGSVQITGSFSEGEARSLARVLNRGAFPVNVEAQSVQTVLADARRRLARGGRDLRHRRRDRRSCCS